MQGFLNKWFGDDSPREMINFNIGMVFISLSYVAALASGLYLGLDRGFYYITGIGMILVAFFVGYAAQSGRYQLAAFCIVLLLDVIIYPIAYFLDGRLLSFMLFYFFVVFLLGTFVLEGRMRIASFFIFLIFWMGSLVNMHYHIASAGRPPFGGLAPIVDVGIPLIICILYSVTSMIASARYYRLESENAEKERHKADEMERAKDIFLMNMSHEIRTPMNAIMSAGEIMLSRDISEDTRRNVHHIMNACKALISTLDDLLAFSKSEDRVLVIQESEYDLGSLIDDIINIISVRLMGSDVKFYAYIDPYIPRRLFGDAVRVRQVFINILNNAVKYTKEGHILLRVVMSEVKTDRMVMHVDVEDTGIGIKEEMIPTLFDDFARVADDMNESLKVEGSGLGLSITKSILSSCGGDISVTSEYNKGSVFSFDIPQRISDVGSLAQVGRAKELGVIVCDDDEKMIAVLLDTLKAMRIKCISVKDSVEMDAAIAEGLYTHLFITPECLMGSCDLPALMSANITIVMMKNVDDPEEEMGEARLIKPINCLNIAQFFENEEQKEKNSLTPGAEEMIKPERVIVSKARAMVIEDNITNMMVAERLLDGMGFDVSTANSGLTAVSLAKVMNFDIIFIDYMMAGMNGIDTLREIRRLRNEWAKNVPCIVLTADTHEGAKQTLINAGFDDYLAKPINLAEMEYMVKKYLPEEKLV